MEPTSGDKKVIDLLSKLKNLNGEYPSDILAARRQMYLRQVANIGLGIGVSAGLKHATKGGNGAGAAGIVSSKVLETILIAAIVVEVGTAAYLYRDKLVDFVKSHTSSAHVQEVTPPSNNGSSLQPVLIETFESPSATITTPSNTSPVIPSGTPEPETANGNGNNGTNASINATPKPGGNNGNQYGLTPKPVRTKDNNNAGNNNGGNNSGGDNGAAGNGNNNGNGKHNKP